MIVDLIFILFSWALDKVNEIIIYKFDLAVLILDTKIDINSFASDFAFTTMSIFDDKAAFYIIFKQTKVFLNSFKQIPIL